jgi:hypothetical protein
MGEWRDISLGEAIELKRGYDLPRQSRVPGTVPLISSSGLTDRHAVAMVKGPGVVTGRYGTLGKVFYVKEDFWPLNTTLYVRDFKGNNPRFISYFLESLDFSAYSDKAAVPGLNRNHLHEARVRLPFDVSEQEAIATTLGAVDDKIDLNRRTNETLESIARAIFKDWFVDFGPTRAKQEGRTPYLASDLWSLFPDRLDEEGKPAGWERIALREAADVFSGGTPAKDKMEFWNGTIPWISPKVMTDIHVTISDDRVTEHAIGRGTRMVPSGSVLVMVRGMGLHEGVRISQARCDVTFNQDVKALVGKRLSGIDRSNMDELRQMQFVFLCIDSGDLKDPIMHTLEQAGISFIDVGMGVNERDGALTGILRATISTPKKRNHVRENGRVSFAPALGPNDYSRNIQVADLNAFNAVLAVLKWKKLCGFYHDLTGEHHTTFVIETSKLSREDE